MLSWELVKGASGGAGGKEPTCNTGDVKRHGFNPWVGKLPWRRACPPTPVFLPGESPWTEETGGLHSVGSQRGTQLKRLGTDTNTFVVVNEAVSDN